MTSLIRVILQKNTAKFIIYSIINFGLVWLFVALFPQIQEDAQELTELFNAYPEDFLKAFGIEGTTLFTDFSSFMSLEYFSIMWPIIILAFVVSFAGGAISGEIEKGTMDILLSQPLSRFKIYIAKYVSGSAMIAVFTFLSIVFTVGLGKLYGLEFELTGFVLVGIIGFLFAMAFLSITMVFSSVFASDGKAMSISLFLILFMYATKIASELNASIENIRYSSLFYYYDFNAALLDQEIPILSIVIFLILIVGGFVLSALYFVKRDIPT